MSTCIVCGVSQVAYWWLLPANSGDAGSIPGWGMSLGEGNGSPLNYSHLGNPMDRRAWRAIVHGVAKESDTTE